MNETNANTNSSRGRPMKTEPSARDAKILKDIRSGGSIRESAEEHGLTVSRVGQIWHRWEEGGNKERAKKKPKTADANMLKAIEAYKNGMKVKDIFNIFRVTAPTFYSYLKKDKNRKNTKQEIAESP